MKNKFINLTLLATLLFSTAALAEEAKPLPPQTLFKNVHVWDGTSEGITQKINVLVEGNLIKKVRAKESDAHAEALVIDADGKTLGAMDIAFLSYESVLAVMSNHRMLPRIGLTGQSFC